MKNAILIVVTAAVFGLTSCGIKMDDAKTPEAFSKAFHENIDLSEKHPIQIRYYEGEKLSGELTMMMVEYFDKNNECFTETFYLAGPGKGTSRQPDKVRMPLYKGDFETMEFITDPGLEADTYEQQVAQAKMFIPAGYNYECVNGYRIRLTANGELERTLWMCVTKQGAPKKVENGKQVTEYYELTFLINPDGSVTLKE